MHNQEIGKQGEALAAQYFIEKGYFILEQNWRHSYYELDLIATKNDILHIIEVKTRTSNLFGHPEESVSPKKFEKILNAAEAYIHLHPEWKRIQYDILSILQIKNKPLEFFLIEDFYI